MENENLFQLLVEAMTQRLGAFEIQVQKTQITFRAPKVFGCVSRCGKKGIVVTFGLPSRVASERIWQVAETYPNRWTHHVKVLEAEQIDEELLGWLQAAYDFAKTK